MARVNKLKREIQSNRYDVDAPAVADAMLRRIRLLKQQHGPGTISGAGRNRRCPEDPRGR